MKRTVALGAALLVLATAVAAASATAAPTGPTAPATVAAHPTLRPFASRFVLVLPSSNAAGSDGVAADGPSFPVSLHVPGLAAWSASTTPALNGSALEEFIRVRYESSSAVKQLRTSVPRWGGPGEFEPSSAEYWQMIGKQAAPGAALLLLSLLAWIGWCGAQCCCATKKAAGVYSRRQRLLPLFLAGLSSLLVAAFAVTALLYTEQLHESVAGEQGLTESASRTVSSANTFIDNLDDRVTDVSAVVLTGTDEIEARLSGSTDVSAMLPTFLIQVQQIGDGVAAHDPIVIEPADPTAIGGTTLTFPCEQCIELRDQMSSVTREVRSALGPVLSGIDAAKRDVSAELLGARDEILGALKDAHGEIDSVHAQVTKYSDYLTDYSREVDKYEAVRRAVVLVIFLLASLGVLAVFILTVALRHEKATKTLVLPLNFFVLLLVWISFLAHLPLALLVADACHYLDGTEPHLQSIDGFEGRVGAVATACLGRQNLLAPLGIADQLAFADGLEFPEIPPTASLLNSSATELAELNTQVQSLSLASIPQYDPSAKLIALDMLNARTNVPPYNDEFTLEDVESCDPDKYTTTASTPVEVRGFRNAVLTAIQAEAQLNALFAEVQANMTALMDTHALLENDVTALVDEAGSLKSSVWPLVVAARSVLSSAYCSPLDDNYLTTKRAFCTGVAESVAGLVMASFFAGVFLAFTLAALWIAARRLEDGTVGELELGASSDGAPSVEEPMPSASATGAVGFVGAPGVVTKGSERYDGPLPSEPPSPRSVGSETKQDV